MESVIKEWAPLSDLFYRLPTKIQNGIFTYDLKLTCVDILTDFIALGTNFGLVYWYDRKKKDLQKLRCESSQSGITTVRIISTVDYMVACGNLDGSISIFQIPKSHPDSLPESLKPKNKQIERYTISDLHSTPISALEWSKNGMKLFSGDKNGHVVLTEIDFYMHLCKSIEILNESYEVVQISYYQQTLLVSTTYRSIICKKEDKWKVTQIGKKDRKVLGTFGGIFNQNSLRPTDVILHCARPGLRIWISDINGSVQQTLLFKDILNQEYPEVPLINPVGRNLRKLKPQKEASFGILLPFSDNLLVTFCNDVVYILNPKELTIVATVTQLRRVMGVAAHKNEIFILEGERSLVRLSPFPETVKVTTPNIPTATSFLPLATSIKDLTSKLQANNIISAIPPFIDTVFASDFNIHTDSTSIVNAEEATESPERSPPQIAMDATHFDVSDSNLVEKISETYKKLEIYNKISTDSYDDTILFKHQRRKKRSDMSASMTSWSSNSSDEKDANISKPTLMNVSTVDVLPDLRSPDSIKNDIESKEKMLADVLCFDQIKIPKSAFENCDTSFDENAKIILESQMDDIPQLSPIYSSSISSNSINTEGDYQNGHLNKIIQRNAVEHYEENTIKSGAEKCHQVSNVIECLPSNSNMIRPKDLPQCVHIPDNWHLKKVTVNLEQAGHSVSDSTFSDWEII